MQDTYYIEERSGVIGLGPLTTSPEYYYRRPKTNWGSPFAWIHLIAILLAIPLIIWNLFLLMDTIELYKQSKDYTPAHPLAVLLVICAILINLLGGVFVLTTEAACFSDKLAKLLFVMSYLSIAISVCTQVVSHNLLGVLWLMLLIIFTISFGIGFWRFTIISSIYLNEEGPVWFKPLLYFCLAAIPILTTSSQCRDAKNVYGCLPNDLFGGREMYMDFFSFTIMTIIAIVSALPYLFGTSHNPE